MRAKALSLTIVASVLCSSASNAQSLFDLLPGFGQMQQEYKEEKDIRFDYNIDFNYYFDNREFKPSSDIFMESYDYNIARLSPSFGVKAIQSRNMTHRLMLGINISKNLGEYPINDKTFSEGEDDPNLINSKLLKEVFYYYNMNVRDGARTFDMIAGVYPRNMMEGDYSKAFFSDEIIMTDPVMEGALLKYKSPRLYAEMGSDWLGSKGLDRYERFMAFSAGKYNVLDWLSAGWAAGYTHIGDSFIYLCKVDNILLNPYVKADYGTLAGLDELSLKAGCLASMQLDRRIEDKAHFPLAGEIIITARKWGAGIENTLFFGDNMMPFKSTSYSEKGCKYYTDLLYMGEPFYFTRRGFASGYDRLELFYAPSLSDALALKVSAVGHFVFPKSEAVGMFLGWQTKASIIFSLDSFRKPSGMQGSGKKSTRRNSASNRPSNGIML